MPSISTTKTKAPACNRGPASIQGPACTSTSALQHADGRQHVSPGNRFFLLNTVHKRLESRFIN